MISRDSIPGTLFEVNKSSSVIETRDSSRYGRSVCFTAIVQFFVHYSVICSLRRLESGAFLFPSIVFSIVMSSPVVNLSRARSTESLHSRHETSQHRTNLQHIFNSCVLDKNQRVNAGELVRHFRFVAEQNTDLVRRFE
jgi:hypothetical protein